ncbi:MAG: peptidase M50, partial [Oscillospiraceae bacterium]|nr:peptidase M50 [Oscillospiraceae bacterium]
MIELKIRKTALRLDFTFFAAVTLFLLTDNTDFGVTALLSCAAHELAHLLVMGICGAEITAVTLYGAGIKIRSDNAERLSAGRQCAIYSAGCLTNFALSAGLWAA